MIAPRTGAEEITVAEEQLEYKPLTCAVYREEATGNVFLLSRWTFTLEERVRVALGEDLYISHLTFGGPLQPLSVQVGPDGYLAGPNPE